MADTIEIVQGTATTIEIAGLQGPQGPQGATGSGLGTLTTQGDTLYQGASAAQRLPIGTAGQILKVNSGGTAPEWGAAPASGVSSVNGETGDVNLAPENISSPQTVVVGEAGNANANGVYIESGTYLTEPIYYKDKNTFIYWDGNNWLLYYDTDDIYFGGSVNRPWDGAWTVPLGGQSPAPSVIQGDTEQFQIAIGKRTSPSLVGDAYTKNVGTGANDVAAGNHTHGNLTNDGKVGTTANLPLKTGTNGVIEAGSFGTAAGSFCEGNDARLSDARTPTAHKASHATGGTDALAPSDIGAQSIFVTEDLGTITANVTLTAARAKIYTVTVNTFNTPTPNVQLPTTNVQAGDVVQIRFTTFTGREMPVRNGNGGFLGNSLTNGQRATYIAASTSNDSWTEDGTNRHAHAAADITSGTITHERGGLEADVSAYNGLVKIASGSTSAVAVTSAGEALLDDADASAQRTTLGAAASGSITSSGLTQATARILGRTSASTGSIEEIQIGSGLSLLAGELSATSSGGVTAVGPSTADVLSVSGSDLVADDPNADRIVFWDDSEGKLRYLEAGSGLSISGTTMTATASGTIGGGTGSTDNSILRSDGTGGSTLQASGIVIEDTVTAFTGITGDAGTDIITATGSAFANGQRVRFTALTGGAGLNTTTNYFVINASGATFQLSTTDGGSASLFTTNITAGTLLTGHAVQTHVQVRNAASDTNSSVALTPKGTGAFVLGAPPDASAANGNSRGSYAVDLQLERSLATRVASGAYSFCAGRSNTASNNDTVAIGNTCNSTGEFSTCVGGDSHSSSGTASIVAGGRSNTASNAEASVFGGGTNTASAVYSATIAGVHAVSDRGGMIAQSNGRFAANGDAQWIHMVLRATTTTNSAVELLINSPRTTNGRLTCPSGKVMSGIINVHGVKSDGTASAHFVRQFQVKNVAGTSSYPYAAATIGTDFDSLTSITFNNPDANGDALSVSVTGITSETWRWTAHVSAVETAYGT